MNGGGGPDVQRFERPGWRIAFDIVGLPIGATMFLGVAVVSCGTAGDTPQGWLMPLMFGFFGLFMLSGVPTVLRRGTERTLIEVSSAGLWMPESGRLRWDEIREVRLEDATIMGGTGRAERGSGYRRLGVVPRDPEAARRAPDRVSWGMLRYFLEFVRQTEKSGMRARVLDVGRVAPFGVMELELDVPLERVMDAIARYAPVYGPDGELLRTRDGDAREAGEDRPEG